MMLACVSIATYAQSGEQPNSVVPVELQVETIDPTVLNGGPHRGPVQPPIIYIENGTLTFVTNCDGCELQLLDEDGEVVYYTIVSGSTLVLPSTLSGSFELQIISGNYIFYGEINL